MKNIVKQKSIGQQVKEHKSIQGQLRIGSISGLVRGIKALSLGSDKLKKDPRYGIRRLAERARSYSRSKGSFGLRSVGGQELRRTSETSTISSPKVN